MPTPKRRFFEATVLYTIGPDEYGKTEDAAKWELDLWKSEVLPSLQGVKLKKVTIKEIKK